MTTGRSQPIIHHLFIDIHPVYYPKMSLQAHFGFDNEFSMSVRFVISLRCVGRNSDVGGTYIQVIKGTDRKVLSAYSIKLPQRPSVVKYFVGLYRRWCALRQIKILFVNKTLFTLDVSCSPCVDRCFDVDLIHPNPTKSTMGILFCGLGS